jgi:hypothetical protein
MFYEHYQVSIKRAKHFNIQSFSQLGLPDPFPTEPMEMDFPIPEDEDMLVYRGNRYCEDNSPNMLIIPSRMVMFKIMRACVGVKNKEDLWFN